MAKIRIKKNEDKPESKEILAEAIVRIGEGFEKLGNSGLNERAIIALIHDYVPSVGKSTIKNVLNALRQLRAWYCKS